MTTRIVLLKSVAPRAARACLLAACSVLIGHSLHAQDTIVRVPSQRVITLADAIRMALDQNSTVRLARSTSTFDSLSVRESRNQFLPNLSATSQSSQGYFMGPRSQINSAGSASSGVRNSFGTSVGLSSSVTLYDGRQNINALHEAQIVLRAGGRDLARAQQTVAFTVASDFLALITQQELLRVQRGNLVAQQQLLIQLEAFVAAGTHPISDLYQQQAATAAAQLAVASANQATELAKVDLIQELVLDPRQSYTFVAPPADSTGGSAFNLDSLISVALAQRADVQAQALRVEAARREILVANGGRLPVISGTVGYGTAINTAASAAFGQQLNQARGGSVGIGISVPLLDRGAVSIARQRAQLVLETAALALRDQIQAATLDVRRAFLSYQAAQEQIVASTAQVKAAALGLQASEARYRVGVAGATFVEVTLAQVTFVQAQSALVTARSNLIFQQALMSYYTGALDVGNLHIDR